MKSDTSKKKEPKPAQQTRRASANKPEKIWTAEGWKNYLRKRYFSKK